MASRPTSTVASRKSRHGQRFFTLAEAQRALPYVSRIVSDIVASYRLAIQVRDRLERPQPQDSPDQLKTEYEATMDRLNELVEELRQVGVELKDFERGLADFPALHQGREIRLCWQLGEPRIAFWHEADAGFTGRQDVSLLEA